MSCRHYCIEFLKKSFSKTFLFHTIIYKYFAGFLACINNSHSPMASRRENEPLGEVIQRKGILLFWIAWRLPDFVADFVLAMTIKSKLALMQFVAITKIFNSISFRDLSLLFIKNLLLKEI